MDVFDVRSDAIGKIGFQFSIYLLSITYAVSRAQSTNSCIFYRKVLGRITMDRSFEMRNPCYRWIRWT